MKGMVDVCGGKCKDHEITREIFHYLQKKPSKMVVEITPDELDYFKLTIWINEEDFKTKC